MRWPIVNDSPITYENKCIDLLIAVWIYHLVMIGKELSKKLTPHMQTVTVGADIIVTKITSAACGNVATVMSYHSCISYAII